jgi:phosphatidylglycerophosphate synthase
LWTISHAAICTSFLIAAALTGPEYVGWAYLFLPAYGTAAFAVLTLYHREGRLLPADYVTLLRLALAFCAAALLVPGRFPFPEPGQPVIFFMLACAAVTDAFDGLAARRWGGSDFGAGLDMETDAYFTLLLSCICVFHFGFGRWVLVFGGLRYIYVLGLLPLPASRSIPRSLNRYEKLACAVTVFSLTAAIAPLSAPLLKKELLLASLCMLVCSFGLDLVWRLKHIESRTAAGNSLYRLSRR